MGGHDQICAALLAPQESGGEVDRIEGAKLRRRRLRGSDQHGPCHIDNVDAIKEPEHRLTPPRQLVIR